MTLQSLEDLFEYQLKTMYYVENRLIEALDELAHDATDDDLSDALAQHREETELHVERLESVFAALDVPAEGNESPSVDGLIREKEAFDDRAAEEDLRNLFYAQAGMKSERFEITGYEGLQTLADRLDYGNGVTDPLAQNRDEEEEALAKLQSVAQGQTSGSLLDRLL